MKKSTIVVACFCGLAIGLHVNPVAAQTSPTAKSASPSAAAPKTSTAAKPATKIAANAPLALNGQKSKTSYALGYSLGMNFHKQSVDIDPNIYLRGLKDALAGAKPLLSDDEARAAIMQLQQTVQADQEQKMKRAGEINKTEGPAFLAANKTKPGVVTLPSGLQYKVITPGTGPKPTLSDTVVCNYRGTLLDGTEFDSSYKRGQPASFPVGGVIKGWTEALQLMPVGSKWQLFVPADLAYGERGAGGAIGPNATLIFEVELLSIQGK